MFVHNPNLDFDYLIIGHLTRDLTENGYRLGGTASYAALTARALGRNAALVSSFDPQLDLRQLDGITIHNHPAAATTTFQNRYTPAGRVQTVLAYAEALTPASVPPAWQNIPLIHIGPVSQLVSPDLLNSFPDSWVGLTPQGWLRQVDSDGLVGLRSWQSIVDWAAEADAVVLSREDLQQNRDAEEQLAKRCEILVVTDADNGAFLYDRNHRTHITARNSTELDPTGCGDIFAAAFFITLEETRNPIKAAEAANYLAAASVRRTGLDSVPTAEEAAWIRNNLKR
ncbi:MAG: hypothetical protein JXA25_13975 [Anaerolineales bacterium]|nr:hypothetical protein [Anaerolineales bacterium]